jgi:hypothetical protein
VRRGNPFRKLRPLDALSVGEAFAKPGADTREWVSFGTVSTDPEPVIFSEEDGQPYVRVTLHPSLRPVLCRVGMEVAGDGEGEYTPFQSGDEVLVVLPGGREDAGATVIKRMANSIDKFPMQSVAGQDPTKNAFGFSRRRTPFIHEYAGPVTFRSAITGAFFSIDKAGVLMFKSGTNSVLQLGPDGLAYQGESSTTSPPKFVLQLLEAGQFIVQVDDAYFQLASSHSSPEISILKLPGPFTVSTSGNAPLEHVLTTEALAGILVALGAAVAPPWTPVHVATALAAAAAAPLDPAVVTALVKAFAAQLQKVATPGMVAQLQPGIGCVGFLAG